MIFRYDNWLNERYFRRHEIARCSSRNWRSFRSSRTCFQQLEHLARFRGCTHIVLDNQSALKFLSGAQFPEAQCGAWRWKISSTPSSYAS